MKKNAILGYCLFLFVFSSFSSSGINIDSLLNIGYDDNLELVTRSEAFYQVHRFYRSCNHDSALKYAQVRYKLFDPSTKDTAYADALETMGLAYSNFGTYDSAVYYLTKSKDLTVELGYTHKLPVIYNNLGYVHMLFGRYEQAKNDFDSCQSLLDPNDSRRAVVLMNLGNVLASIGTTKEALERYFLAQQILEENGNEKTKVALNIKIAQEYIRVKDFKNAEEILAIAINDAKRLGLKDKEALASGVLGELYVEKDDLLLAKESYDHAYSLFKEMNALSYIAATTYCRAELSMQLQNYDEMLADIEEGKAIAKQTNDTTHLVKYELLEANYYLETGQLNKALVLAKQVHEKLIASEECIENAQKVNYVLYRVYKANNKAEKALLALESYYQNRDSLFSEEKVRELSEIEAKYQLEKEREFLQLKSKNEQKLLKTWIFAMGLVLTISLVFLLLLFKWNAIRRKLNILLKQRNILIQEQRHKLKVGLDKVKKSEQEKEILLKEIHHRVKNNMQVISSLLELQLMKGEKEDIGNLIVESQNRVRAMGYIHQLLYQSEDIRFVDMSAFIHKLLKEMKIIYGVSGRERIKLDCGLFDIDTAIPLGLILTELVSNSFKYAIRGDHIFELEVSIEEYDCDYYCLVVRDNGLGLNTSIEETGIRSLGMSLVKSLTKQLMGKLSYKYDKGAIFTILFASKRYRDAC